MEQYDLKVYFNFICNKYKTKRASPEIRKPTFLVKISVLKIEYLMGRFDEMFLKEQKVLRYIFIYLIFSLKKYISINM